MDTNRARRWWAITLAIVGVLASAGWSSSQESDDRSTATFYDRLHVPLINVEVVATDRDGAPIRDLTVDDFEILEDGRRVEITHFSAPSPAEGHSIDLDVATPLPEVRDRVAYLVVYVDDFNVDRRLRGSALARISTILSRPLPPGVKAFVVRFNGRLHVECEPSERPEDLLAALDRVQKQTPMDFTREGEILVRSMQRDAQTSVSAGRGPADLVDENIASAGSLQEFISSSYLPLIHNYAAQQYDRSRTSLQGLTNFIRYLQGVRGRKAVLWLGRIEPRAGENLLRTYWELFPAEARSARVNPMMNSMRYDLTGQLRDVLHFANSHRVSFYPLGPLRAGMEVDFDFDDRILVTSGRPGSVGPTDPRAEAEALDMMSGLTGGRTLHESRLDQELARVSDDLNASYSLAYRPPTPEDGKYHRIKVKVKRDGLEVRHRQGYRMMDGGGELAARTVSAAVLGVADNSLGIAVGCRDHEPRDDGLFLVPVTVDIPIGDLVLTPEAEQHVARISVASVVRDARGRLSDVHERSYPITIANDRLISSVDERATFVLGMVLRQGPQRVTVSVRDDYSSIVSIGYVDLVVGDAKGNPPE